VEWGEGLSAVYRKRHATSQQVSRIGYLETCKIRIREENHDDTTSTTPFYRRVRCVVVVNFESSMVEFQSLYFT